jgi:hypothetical protein
MHMRAGRVVTNAGVQIGKGAQTPTIRRPGEPIEAPFRIVSEPPSGASWGDASASAQPARLPIPYGGTVIHREVAPKGRDAAPRRLDSMTLQLVQLADIDPDGAEVAAMLARQRLAAVEEAEYARQLAIAEASQPKPPTMSDLATRLAMAALQAQAGLADLSSETRRGRREALEQAEDDPHEIRRVHEFRSRTADVESYDDAEAEYAEPGIAPQPASPAPPWRRASWFERLFGTPAAPSKRVWR